MADRSYESLSADQLASIDLIAAEFETKRLGGQSDEIEPYLGRIKEPLRPNLLVELVAVEIQDRRMQGESFSIADYLARFPTMEEAVRAGFEEVTEGADVSIADTQRDSSCDPDSHLIETGKLPEQFGRYRIIKLLGKGGMGEVYLADDTSLGRSVAIKVPHFGTSDSKVKERLFREARIMGTVEHSHLCPVYDVGEINGQIYIAMAHIQGGTLAEKLQQGRFSDREAASTIARIARAVEAAHRLGIIHRDLKLGNVMLNSQSDPIVMDFGTAREAGRDESITREGALVGTPAYMAPEQLTASKVEIGPVTDVYAMGVMLYELLAGQRPFRGTPLQIIKEADRARPPALEGVDPRLERICLQAMHKNPERRFQTAAELGTALEEFLSKPPKGNSLSRAVGSALCLMFILAVAWQTASFLLKTPQGTIRIVVPMDAEIEIELAKDGNRQRIGKSQNWEIAIEPGAYRLKLISKNKSAEPVFKIQGDKLAVVQRRKTTKIVIKAVRSAERVSPLTPHLLPKQPVVLKESTGRFVDSGQTLGSEYSVYSAAGDVDRDGDVDVVVANSIQGPNRIWLNDGKGNFSVGQEIPYRYCAIVKLGDLDADGDLDLMFGGLTRGAPMTMWVNNGSGTYTESSHSLGEAYCSSFDFGDLDGDGDLDIVGGIRGENRVWLNEGDCIFCEADERLGEFPTNKVALGDLDGDNDLDIFSVNINEPDRVWLNDGHANFTDSEQELGNFNGRDVVLADADRDGDLDAYVVCLGAGNAIWVNDGKARFSPLPFLENDYRPDSIVVADFNGDQVMDRFVGHYSVEKIRLGPGPNLVSISGIPGHWEDTLAGELQTKQAVTADFDGDGDLDLFLANAFHTPNVVWLNEDLPDE